jgi:Protein of unknown function (DUF4013)
VNPVAASFAWPFRGDRVARWLVGMLMVLLLPIAFIPLLGYAVAATRAAAADPSTAPPPWRLTSRLLSDGLWVAFAVIVITAPFVLFSGPLATLFDNAHLWRVSDPNLSHVYSSLGAGFALALPWGIVLLLLMPHATARFAATGRPLDLFDFPSALRGVGRDFATWNLAAAAMVTAWAVGLACVGLVCVGIVPGVFYAILVSAHACAALDKLEPQRAQVENPTPG